MNAEWIKPTVEAVRARRESNGCGLMTARKSLEWDNIQRAMPDIMEKQDFARLGDVVQWLLLNNRPSSY